MTEENELNKMNRFMNESKNKERNCANCACHHVQENKINKLETQSFCRRDTPTAAQMRGERPRVRDGKPDIDKHGRPIMENVMEVIYLYKPTMPDLTCFDGWRPIGTLPGERASTEFSSSITAAMRRLYQDMMQGQDEAELDALLRAGSSTDAIDDEGKNN